MRAIVTGANSGIGLVAARHLAAQGYDVVLGIRDPARGEIARSEIAAAVPEADVTVSVLDLADLSSVRAFAARETTPLDVLVCNAGVMATPHRWSVDGFELQFATNHLGHFALAGLLLPALLAARSPRLTVVSSLAHQMGRIDFDDLMSERRYRKWAAYGRSKLANLLFVLEAQRRASEAGSDLLVTAAHPGITSTALYTRGRRVSRWHPSAVFGAVAGRVAQSAEVGALPVVHAATAQGLPPAAYVGPDGVGEWRGRPTLVGRSARALDLDMANRLWLESERLTSVTWTFGGFEGGNGTPGHATTG